MLSADQSNRLREALNSDSDISCIDAQHVGNSFVRLPITKILEPSSNISAGHLYGPEYVLGTPFDPDVLGGIGSWEIHAPARSTSAVSNGRIIGAGAIIDEHGYLYNPELVKDQADLDVALSRNLEGRDGYALAMHENRYRALYPSRLQPRHIDMSAFFFHNIESANFGSFIFRQLPQMILASEQVPANLGCYVVGDRTSWFLEAIDLLQLPRLPVFTINEVAGDIFSTVFVCNDFDAEAFLQPDTNHGISKLVKEVKHADGPAKIYVSRSLSGVTRQNYRHTTNEIAVEEIMRQQGYEVVYPETLTLRSQIQKFRNARCIVGPSGSGMFNAVFSPAGARILDIETYHHTVRQHAKFYSSQGHSYGFLFASMDPDDNSHPIFRRSHVPLDLLLDALDLVEARTKSSKELVYSYKFGKLERVAIEQRRLVDESVIELPEGRSREMTSDGEAAIIVDDVTHQRRTVTTPALQLSKLPAGSLLFGGRYILCAEDIVVEEQVLSGDIDEISNYVKKNVTSRETVEVDEPCLLVVREGISTWGHWLGELLPKAVLVEKHIPNYFKFALLDVYGDFEVGSRWRSIKDSSLAYGFDDTRAIKIADDKNYRFTNLHALTPLWSHGIINPHASAAMRGRPSSLAGPANQRSFLLRNAEDGRNIFNLSEVEAVLHRHGFITVEIGRLSFSEQADVFAGSSALAGVLGSTFTGLIYCAPGVKVVAFSPKTFGDSFFYGLTCERQGHFVELRSDVTVPNPDYPRSSDFAVDCQLLEETLKMLELN